MSAPRFIERIADAVGPVLGVGGADLARRLNVTVGLETRSERVPESGWLLSANLLARLYPAITLRGPRALVDAARERILTVNPRCDINDDLSASDVRLVWAPAAEPFPAVSVWARGLDVGIDGGLDEVGEADPLAALAAAALGVGEVFRAVFAPELGRRGRGHATPFALNLVTLGEPGSADGTLVRSELGRVALIGAGAIGQAATLALAATGARGSVDVIDPEKAELSNLQRYVLLGDSDENVVKAKHATRHLRAAGIDADAKTERWHAALADAAYTAVLVALDSEQDRIGVQASLPGTIFNAWTQTQDLGWSRHEQFGQEPCLACLYWPRGARPHPYETLAAELAQPELRVLAYLVGQIAAGAPLPPERMPSTPLLPAPPDATEWTQRSILDDIAAAASVPISRFAQWRDKPIADLHRDVICAGALLDLKLTDDPRAALVPLAHQSALAGIMLAVQALVSRHPDLRLKRPAPIEARWDMLAPLPQVVPRPRTRAQGCICSDQDFRAVVRGCTVAS